MKNVKLDEYEKDVLHSYEKGEWVSLKNTEEEIERHQECAKNTLRKDKRVNIRISSKDLENVKILALQEGIPYQTLISSVVHKFANGTLINKPVRNRGVRD